jgi:dTDP-4-amino-4,6-dideoxygalactose transaminase
MCTTNDEALAERLSILRLHGGKPKYYHAVVGGNFRLDALQAAVLLVKLEYLDKWTAGRQANANYYDRAFATANLEQVVALPELRTGSRHIFNQYVIRVPRRDELKQYLADAGIGTEIYYPVPLHLQTCFASLGYSQGDCPEAERAAGESLAVPIYPELSDEQQDYVVSQIAEFYA